MKKVLKIIISIGIPLLIGYLGSIFTTMSVGSWYLTLSKPFFNPPNYLFGPVWTFLYILIGISFYLVWKNGFGGKEDQCIIIYSLQLALNLLWSIMFFGLRSPLFGLIDIILLLFLILANIIIFYRVSKAAGLILIPYFLWVSFATLLNYSIVILN